MELHSEQLDGWTRIQLTGNLDAGSAGEAQRSLLPLITGEPRSYILELEGVPAIDSAGLAVLVKLYREIKSRGGQMALAGVQREPMRVFHLTRLDRIFPIHPTAESARAAA
ncbi:MAG: STAS domain-containing protein [Candidatus Eisenbacteria bacterium]|nr:STAS domain-containing protein [Candidatus Eisenbacteria bacterium]